MFASGNPNCVSILACGECLTAKCVSTCRNYHVSRRLDIVQFRPKNRDHSFNNSSLLLYASYQISYGSARSSGGSWFLARVTSLGTESGPVNIAL